MSRLVPSTAAMDALAALPDDGPVVMLNLLRFKPDGGAKAYAQYSRDFLELLAEAGGRLLYTGKAEQSLVGKDEWHHVALVEYPNRRAFLDTMQSEAYKRIHHNREAGLADTVLYATRPNK